MTPQGAAWWELAALLALALRFVAPFRRWLWRAIGGDVAMTLYGQHQRRRLKKLARERLMRRRAEQRSRADRRAADARELRRMRAMRRHNDDWPQGGWGDYATSVYGVN